MIVISLLHASCNRRVMRQSPFPQLLRSKDLTLKLHYTTHRLQQITEEWVYQQEEELSGIIMRCTFVCSHSPCIVCFLSECLDSSELQTQTETSRGFSLFVSVIICHCDNEPEQQFNVNGSAPDGCRDEPPRRGNAVLFSQLLPLSVK